MRAVAGCGGALDVAAVMSSSKKLIKEEIDGGNLAVPDDYEIGSGVSWRLARAARHPTDPTTIAYPQTADALWHKSEEMVGEKYEA
jgi:hypothetical protein